MKQGSKYLIFGQPPQLSILWWYHGHNWRRALLHSNLVRFLQRQESLPLKSSQYAVPGVLLEREQRVQLHLSILIRTLSKWFQHWLCKNNDVVFALWKWNLYRCPWIHLHQVDGSRHKSKHYSTIKWISHGFLVLCWFFTFFTDKFL